MKWVLILPIVIIGIIIVIYTNKPKKQDIVTDKVVKQGMILSSSQGLQAPNSNFSEYHLGSQDLSNSDFHNSNFSKADLSNVNLSNSNLQFCDFSETNLTNTNFTNSDLTGSTFGTLATLNNTNFTNTNLTGVTLPIRLNGGNFTNANFELVNFCGIDLGGAILTGYKNGVPCKNS